LPGAFAVKPLPCPPGLLLDPVAFLGAVEEDDDRQQCELHERVHDGW
jgi:hypothetical protein